MMFIKRDYDQHYYQNALYREGAHSQRNQKRVAALRQKQKDGVLLEVGCGEGGFLRQAEAFFEVEGMDISPYAVQIAQEHFGEQVQVGNVEQQPLPPSRYDAAAAFNILEHLHAPGQAITHLYDCLKSGGWLIGSVPNNQGLVGGVATRIGNYVDRTHVSTFTPSVWERLFRQAGFRQVIFFGEITLSRNRCWYIYQPWWKAVSFNLMFLCQRG